MSIGEILAALPKALLKGGARRKARKGEAPGQKAEAEAQIAAILPDILADPDYYRIYGEPWPPGDPNRPARGFTKASSPESHAVNQILTRSNRSTRIDTGAEKLRLNRNFLDPDRGGIQNLFNFLLDPTTQKLADEQANQAGINLLLQLIQTASEEPALDRLRIEREARAAERAEERRQPAILPAP